MSNFLGNYFTGDTVFYAENFHNDQGALEDPSATEAQIRSAAGAWTALTAPTKQNAKTGHFGGTVPTTSFTAGQYAIRMAGTVSTSKLVAAEFYFNVTGYNPSAPPVALTAQGRSNIVTFFDNNAAPAIAYIDYLATAGQIAALNNLSQSQIRTAIGMAAANLDSQLATIAGQVGGLNNLSQAQIRTAIGMVAANLDAQLAGLVTNAALPLKRNAAGQSIPIYIRDSTNPLLGKPGTPTVTVSFDGGSTFLATTGTVTPIGSTGWSWFRPAAADISGVACIFKGSLAGGVDYGVAVYTHA